jgi:hypothetical protein
VKENEISRACSTNRKMEKTNRVKVYVVAYIIIFYGYTIENDSALE